MSTVIAANFCSVIASFGDLEEKRALVIDRLKFNVVGQTYKGFESLRSQKKNLSQRNSALGKILALESKIRRKRAQSVTNQAKLVRFER